jgi:alpha-tubulin suppressor-like RCC1 family protein
MPGALNSIGNGTIPTDADGFNAYSNVVGRGFANSNAIVAAGNDSSTAAGAARSYRGGGLSDWYLPTFDELGLANPSTYGFVYPFIGDGSYATSSDFGGAYFMIKGWTSTYHNKTETYYVRPIRAFSPTQSLTAPAFTLSRTSETATVGSPISGYTINSSGGAIASYSISPAVSYGLTFDTSTGLISGTPTSVAVTGTYTVTATNLSGSTSSIFLLNANTDQSVPIAISASWWHSCSLMSNKAIKCWGYNGNGELGDGGTTNSLFPARVVDITNATSVFAGGGDTCAILIGGTVECWGYSDGAGRTGTGLSIPSSTPMPVLGISNATSMATLGGSNCALLSSGGVACWGWNGYGEVGNGTFANQPRAVAVTGITTATQIVGGDGHACALLANNTVNCWGNNNYGQLGNGTTINSSIPVLVTGLTNVIQLSASADHSCALVAIGNVYCWGHNAYGETGDGLNSSTLSPKLVPNLNSATQISSTSFSNCAVLLSQSIKCWGRNDHGQLGDGTFLDSHIPVSVRIGPTNIISITSGDNHSCLLLSNNSVVCWGMNLFGQLGNGLTSDSNVPVSVSSFPSPPSLAPPLITLSRTSETATVGSPISGYTINSSGGAIASYSISPAVSYGLTFDTSTGLIAGTPTSTDAAGLYTITGTNAAGSATAQYRLNVNALATITNANITIVAPATGATPVTSISSNGQYTTAISWSGSPSRFASATVYTATVTVTPVSGYKLAGVRANFFTVNGNAATSANSENTGSFTYRFVATGGKLPQTITFPRPANMLTTTADQLLSATSTSGLPVYFNTYSPAVCTIATIAGSQYVRVVPSGAPQTCVINASQIGNATFAPATWVQVGFNINKVAQTITFNQPYSLKIGTNQTLSASSTSGLSVSYSSYTPSICTISAGNKVTAVAATTNQYCVIAATQSGNTIYAGATPVTKSLYTYK